MKLSDLSSTHVDSWAGQAPASGCERRLRRKRVMPTAVAAAGQQPVEHLSPRRAGDVHQSQETRSEVGRRLHRSPGSPRSRGAPLCRQVGRRQPRRPAGGDQKSGARWWICTIQNVFRHFLGTCINRPSLRGHRAKRSADAAAASRRTGGDGCASEGGAGCALLLLWPLVLGCTLLREAAR